MFDPPPQIKLCDKPQFGSGLVWVGLELELVATLSLTDHAPVIAATLRQQ